MRNKNLVTVIVWNNRKPKRNQSIVRVENSGEERCYIMLPFDLILNGTNRQTGDALSTTRQGKWREEEIPVSNSHKYIILQWKKPLYDCLVVNYKGHVHQLREHTPPLCLQICIISIIVINLIMSSTKLTLGREWNI